MADKTSEILEHASAIVSAYVANNTIPKENLGSLIADTFQSLARIDQTPEPVEDLKPAVPIKKVSPTGSHRLPGGRENIQKPETAFGAPLQHDAG